ncbi:MAG: hypothetical protein K8F91_00415, partial [Candidatus Obscuribacterales bacterium]|nr:hypothetical protein [Candidatus Obscuribacterales bacterium]
DKPIEATIEPTVPIKPGSDITDIGDGGNTGTNTLQNIQNRWDEIAKIENSTERSEAKQELQQHIADTLGASGEPKKPGGSESAEVNAADVKSKLTTETIDTISKKMTEEAMKESDPLKRAAALAETAEFKTVVDGAKKDAEVAREEKIKEAVTRGKTDVDKLAGLDDKPTNQTRIREITDERAKEIVRNESNFGKESRQRDAERIQEDSKQAAKDNERAQERVKQEADSKQIEERRQKDYRDQQEQSRMQEQSRKTAEETKRQADQTQKQAKEAEDRAKKATEDAQKQAKEGEERAKRAAEEVRERAEKEATDARERAVQAQEEARKAQEQYQKLALENAETARKQVEQMQLQNQAAAEKAAREGQTGGNGATTADGKTPEGAASLDRTETGATELAHGPKPEGGVDQNGNTRLTDTPNNIDFTPGATTETGGKLPEGAVNSDGTATTVNSEKHGTANDSSATPVSAETPNGSTIGGSENQGNNTADGKGSITADAGAHTDPPSSTPHIDSASADRIEGSATAGDSLLRPGSTNSEKVVTADSGADGHVVVEKDAVGSVDAGAHGPEGSTQVNNPQQPAGPPDLNKTAAAEGAVVTEHGSTQAPVQLEGSIAQPGQDQQGTPQGQTPAGQTSPGQEPTLPKGQVDPSAPTGQVPTGQTPIGQTPTGQT